MRMRHYAAGLLAIAASAAQAKDDRPCPTGLICASRPQSVAAALQAAGYKAQLFQERDSDPIINSAAAGYNFDVMFFDCEQHIQCGSIQLRLTFSPYENHTPEIANLWNRDRRLLKAEARADKRMAFVYDWSTVGGLNQTNFADTMGWWSTMLGEVDKFFREHPAGKALPASPS